VLMYYVESGYVNNGYFQTGIYIDWDNRIIYIPRFFLIEITPNTSYVLDTSDFRLALKELEASEQGMIFPNTHNHNTEATLGGVTYARLIEIINDYTITFEEFETPYRVFLTGSNNNILDVTNLGTVSIAPNNSAGLISVDTNGGSGATPVEIADAVRQELITELDRIDTPISSRASQDSVNIIDNKLDDLISSIDLLADILNIINVKIDDIDDSVNEVKVDITDMFIIISQIKKFNFNRSKIDAIEKTLTVYDDDGITPIVVFSLLDTSTQPSVTEVAEKLPL